MFEMVEEVLVGSGLSKNDQDPMIVQEISDHYSDCGIGYIDPESEVEQAGIVAIYRYITNRKVPFTPGRNR